MTTPAGAERGRISAREKKQKAGKGGVAIRTPKTEMTSAGCRLQGGRERPDPAPKGNEHEEKGRYPGEIASRRILRGKRKGRETMATFGKAAVRTDREEKRNADRHDPQGKHIWGGGEKGDLLPRKNPARTRSTASGTSPISGNGGQAQVQSPRRLKRMVAGKKRGEERPVRCRP